MNFFQRLGYIRQHMFPDMCSVWLDMMIAFVDVLAALTFWVLVQGAEKLSRAVADTHVNQWQSGGMSHNSGVFCTRLVKGLALMCLELLDDTAAFELPGVLPSLWTLNDLAKSNVVSHHRRSTAQ